MSLAQLQAVPRARRQHEARQARRRGARLVDLHHEELRLWFIRRAGFGDDHSGQGEAWRASQPGRIPRRGCAARGKKRSGSHRTPSVLGGLDDVKSIFGTVVSPFVGKLLTPVEPVADQREVARVFSVSWEDLTERRGYRRETWGERNYPMHFWQLEGETIWGLTGFFVNTLIEMEKNV